MRRDHGADLYRLAAIPAGTYRGIDRDIGTIGVSNVLVASSLLDDDLVAAIARVLFERKDALVAAHPEARHLTRPDTFDNAPAEYHQGAVRYYREGR
jgi:TRAP transporter TAXI family solute receptor